MAKTYEEAIGEAFADGAKYALEYFRDEVYGDGVMETDLWKDYFGCLDCGLDSEKCECND